jgi:hypothetical protein
MTVGAIVLAALLGFLGVRSALRSSAVRFEAETLRDHLLYSIHVAARTSVWFALAGAFVGFAVLDEPERFQWYVLVPLGLAALQVLAAIALWRSPPPPGSDARGTTDGDRRRARDETEPDGPPGTPGDAAG